MKMNKISYFCKPFSLCLQVAIPVMRKTAVAAICASSDPMVTCAHVRPTTIADHVPQVRPPLTHMGMKMPNSCTENKCVLNRKLLEAKLLENIPHGTSLNAL